MKIRSQDQASVLTIESRGSELSAYPSINISVDLRSPLASGTHGEVWLDLPSIEAFLQATEELDRRRVGFATIKAMSPEDFGLRIYSLDSRGHLGIDVSISGTQHIGEHPMTYSVELSFEIDPSSIAQIASDFKSLVKTEQNRTSTSSQ